MNAMANSGGTSLMFAAGAGHTEAAEVLIAAGADVNAKLQAKPEFLEQVGFCFIRFRCGLVWLGFGFVWFWFVSFGLGFVSSRFASFRFVSFRPVRFAVDLLSDVSGFPSVLGWFPFTAAFAAVGRGCCDIVVRLGWFPSTANLVALATVMLSSALGST